MGEILILVGGGIGDQVCAEPTIRYAVDQFPELSISVLTAFPELFSHIRGVKAVFQLGKDRDIDVKNYVVRGTYPGIENDDLGAVLCSVHTNGVDYCAMMALKWNLPIKARTIHIPSIAPDGIVPGAMTARAVLSSDRAVIVHPGRSWESKTYSAAWWERVVAEFQQSGISCVVIGAEIGPTGTVGKFSGRDVIDLRGRLTLPQTTWLLQRSRVVITNDSAPLHLAASRDPDESEGVMDGPWIGFLSTAKHPDFLKHYRKTALGHAIFGHKMQNLTLGGLWSKRGLTANVKAATIEELESWLPPPVEVVKWAVGKLKGPVW